MPYIKHVVMPLSTLIILFSCSTYIDDEQRQAPYPSPIIEHAESYYHSESPLLPAFNNSGQVSIVFENSGKEKYCSGFIIEGNYLITASHCFDVRNEPTSRMSEIVSVYFDIGAKTPDRINRPNDIEIDGSSEIILNEAIDIAIINLQKLDFVAGVSYGMSYRTDLSKNLPLQVIHVPKGYHENDGKNGLRITRGRCWLVEKAETGFYHGCVTDMGSSGAAVVDERGIAVGVHVAGPATVMTPNNKNRAVSFDKIQEIIQKDKFNTIDGMANASYANKVPHSPDDNMLEATLTQRSNFYRSLPIDKNKGNSWRLGEQFSRIGDFIKDNTEPAESYNGRDSREPDSESGRSQNDTPQITSVQPSTVDESDIGAPGPAPAPGSVGK